MKSLLSLVIFIGTAHFSIMAQTAACQDITIQLDDTGQALIVPSDVDNGSIGVEPIQYDLSQNTFNCSDMGVVNVTLTVSDDLGLSDDCISSVTVVDNIAPNVVCTEVADWPVDEIITAIDIGIVSDNCGVSSTLVLPNSFDQPGTYSVSLIAFDNGGSASTCVSIVNVIGDGSDNEAPIISECPSLSSGVELDEVCNYVVEDFTDLIVATDNVSSPENLVITQSPIPGTELSGSAMQSIVFTVTDEANISTTCSMNLERNDVHPPTIINCPMDQTGVIFTTYIYPDFRTELGAYDNCTDNFNLTTLQNPAAGSETNVPGIHNMTVEVIDESGNIGSCNFLLELFDETDVSAYCQDVDVMLDNFGNAEVTPEMIDDGSYGTGSLTLVLDQNSLNCSNVGANIVTLTATDESENTGSCDAVVTVLDDLGPEISCTNYSITLDSEGNGIITVDDIIESAFDNCGIGSLTLSQTEFDSSDAGMDIPVVLTAMDFSGNTSSCTALVSVSELGSGTNAVCQDLTILLDDSGNVSITPDEVDNGSYAEGTIVSMTLDEETFDCNSIGSNPVVLSITDDSSNESSCTSIITVYDLHFPTVVTNNLTVSLDGSGMASIAIADLVVSANDNCGMPTISAGQTEFQCSDIGTNSITVLATDPSGNSTVSITEVTVTDIINPQAVCQDYVLMLNEEGNGTLEASDIDGGSVDNCMISLMTISQADFIQEDIGSNEVELTVTDSGGNSSSCTSNVSVIEDSEPIFTCPGDMSIEGNADCTIECPDFQSETSAVNFCGDPSDWDYIQTPEPGTILSGPTEIFITISDDCDNSQTCSFTVSMSGLIVSVNVEGGTLSTDLEADNYQWYYCGSNAIPGANESSFTPTESGSYSLSVIANSCSGSSDCEEVILTGIEETELSIGMDLFPNPNDGNFSINFESNSDNDYLISIYNQVGQIIYQDKNWSENTINFDLKEATPGIYMILIQDGETMAKRPFVIE